MHAEPPPVPLVRNFLPIPDTLDPGDEQVDLSIFGFSGAVTWNELDGWWRHFEVDDLVRQLSDAEVEMFLRVVDATSHFAEQLRSALDAEDAGSDSTASRGNLRAI